MKKVYVFTIGALLSLCLVSTQNFYAAAAAVAKENPFTKRKRELGEQLFEATKRGNLEQVYELIRLKAPVDFKDELTGYTSLAWASERNMVAFVRALLNAGANVNVRNFEGATSLLLAAKKGHVDVVKRLLAAKADTDIQDNLGFTPLIAAIFLSRRLNLDIVDLLLDAGANVNIQTLNNGIALMYAVIKYLTTNDDNYRHVIKTLILHGTDLFIQNKRGDTALSLAVIRPEMGIKELIQQAVSEREQRGKHISSTLEREQNIPSPVARIIGEYEGSITPRAPRAVSIEAGESEVEEKEGADIQKQKNLEDID